MFRLNKCFICGICVLMALAGNIKDKRSNDIGQIDIQQEIDDYRMHFIELYSNNAMEDSDSSLHIEELDVELDESGAVATLVKYSDRDNRYLRYRVDLYGETMSAVINYCLCEDFVLVSRQNNYYSSWILTAGWDDVLYSEIDKWIIWNDIVYSFSEDGRLTEIDKEQLEFPALCEIESY